MAKETKNTQKGTSKTAPKEKKQATPKGVPSKEGKVSCTDVKCPFHGSLSVRGRTFKGTVIKKFPTRVVIEFERTLYIRKYERYAKARTKLHAQLPECMQKEIEVGDYIEIKECRKLSKIINFVVMKKIRGVNQK